MAISDDGDQKKKNHLILYGQVLQRKRMKISTGNR